MGLPLIRLNAMLRAAGINVLQRWTKAYEKTFLIR
jgi:hypothetical protein